MSSNQSDDRQPTLDGERTRLSEILPASADNPQSSRSLLRRILHNANLFLAGMYTGTKCSGNPHTRHSYDRDPDERIF